ncbi:OB-fold domain-containing protein [Rhodococcus sp. T2V]|uniref:Zn-ribbon domain-containing OB-fold protein n=1 Tax=Rhodococcus sp. T2V TaxID=3034164 RepID=UPI0023E334B1|nr:OB-fold domain-containing protein [Rhodococcus sp. T2V]MDF3312890.1 OB-fold domain-containing protein [Rhodococcus sp. T2V]
MSTTIASAVPRPGPVTTTVTEPYWKCAADGELWIQKCEDCGRCQHYPAGMCRSCWSENLDWIRAAGTGTVWAFTVVGKPGHPAWERDAPYVLALVELDEGPRMMTNIVGCDPATVHVGQRVLLAPHTPGSEQPPLQFLPDTPSRDPDNGRTSP